jgi:hypothetical protein
MLAGGLRERAADSTEAGGVDRLNEAVCAAIEGVVWCEYGS